MFSVDPANFKLCKLAKHYTQSGLQVANKSSTTFLCVTESNMFELNFDTGAKLCVPALSVGTWRAEKLRI